MGDLRMDAGMDGPKLLSPGKLGIIADFRGRNSTNQPLAYVIRRTDGAGLMATLGTVLTQLAVSEWLDAEPFVDLTRGSAYSEGYPVNGTRNVWEYYFAPVGKPLTLLKERDYRVIYSEEHHPVVHWDDLEAAYRFFWNKYVVLNSHTAEFVEQNVSALGITGATIGVHVRGGDMRTAPNHPLPPSVDQLQKAIWRLLDTAEYENIFVAAQDEIHLDLLRRSFGQRVFSSGSFRFTGRTSRRGTPYSGRPLRDVNKFASAIRPNHRFELGREVLQDVFMLSRAGALVSGNSNVALWSKILRDSILKDQVTIENGWNVANPFLAALTWRARSALPAALGGFKSWSDDWIKS